jgi:hypothetical protein
MFHLIRFAAGVLTGVAAVALIKSKKTRAGLEKAGDELRGAAASTFRTVEKVSDRMRGQPEPEKTASQAEAPKPEADSLKRAATTARPKKTPSGKE